MHNQGGQQTPYWLGYNFQTCRDDRRMAAYTLYDLAFIIICPKMLPPQNRFGATLDDRNTDYTTEAHPHIETIAGTTSMTILHELFHVAHDMTTSK